MAYRNFSYPNVLKKLDLIDRHSDFATGVSPVPVREWFVEFFQEGLAIAVGNLGICSEKAKSEFIISPLLIELRRVMARCFSVFSGMELNINKARGLNGACDFILTKGDNQHLREAPIIGVLEAKNEDFSRQGMGQCIASLYAAQLRNQKAGWSISRVFGAVTTGRAWDFLYLEGNVVTLDRPTRRVDHPSLGQVMGILKRQIETAVVRTPLSGPVPVLSSHAT